MSYSYTLGNIPFPAYSTNQNVGVTPSYYLPGQYQSMGYCTQFPGIPCNEPESFTNRTDILNAAQQIQNAIYAPDLTSTTFYLNTALTQLQNAQNYFVSAGLTNLQARTQQVINVLTNIINQLQVAPNLAVFQNSVLYGFQGVISALRDQHNNSRGY